VALEVQPTQNRVQENAVSYALHTECGPRFRAVLRRLVDDGAKRFFDVGGGALPALPLGRIRACGLEYVLLDASADELAKAPDGYEGVQADVLDTRALAELVRERGLADAVISHWTAEHIPSGEQFHRNVFDLLRPGGTAVHLFPTLYAVPFVINRILSPERSSTFLFRVHRARKVKFPAYYSWCRGPSRRQLRRLVAIGYTVESYTGFFGHYFYAPVKPVHRAHEHIAEMLVEHPVPALTSFALVVLKRPA